MEKKHRDIVVDGQQYGWIASYLGKDIIVKVYKDKKEYFSKAVRMTSITPVHVADFIKEYNEAIRQIELRETLDKEWTAFLNTIPWNGSGSTIAESNRIFDGKRKYWMKKMIKKHNAEISMLEDRYEHD